MKEDFLHYLWRFKKFDFLNLKTTDGQAIEIVNGGNHNTDAGPDFLNSTIKINKTQWAGSVEMHINSSDWLKHKHSDDPAYNNVVLHVVWKEDVKILDQNDKAIPCLELETLADPSHINKYQQLLSSQLWIPCQENIEEVPSIKITKWLERLMIERLEEKTKSIKPILKSTENNWEQVLFILVAKNLGLKPNSSPMEAMASATPIELLYKHADNAFALEAILFGQSGLLSSKLKDDFPIALLKEYDFMSKKYSLSKPSYPNWKLLRLRPNNFPTIRISQLVNIYSQNKLSFDKILDGTIKEITYLFDKIYASEYWNEHYLFDKKAERSFKKNLGKSRRNVLLINAIVPLLFLYGKERANEKYIDKSLTLLTELPAEKNTILKKWSELKISAASAFDSQALIHLKSRYCNNNLCLRCTVGHHIMNKKIT